MDILAEEKVKMDCKRKDAQNARNFIAEHSFKEGNFTLASGKKSNVFFDLKQTMLDHRGLSLLTDLVWEKVKYVEADYIGGLAMGAVPVLIATVLKSSETEKPLNGFWVRKEQKTHGMRSSVDGPIQHGRGVIIVDDVTTTGESVLQAVKAVENIGCNIKYILTVVDRDEGAKEAVKNYGYELDCLFDRYDFTNMRPNDISE